MSTASPTLESTKALPKRRITRSTNRRFALDNISLDELYTIGQDIDNLPIEDYGSTADIDVDCYRQIDAVDLVQPMINRLSVGKSEGVRGDYPGDYHCLHVDCGEHYRHGPNYDSRQPPVDQQPNIARPNRTLFVTEVDPDAKVVRILEYRAPKPSQVSLRLSRYAGAQPVSFWVTIDFLSEYYQPMIGTDEGDNLVQATLKAVNDGLAGITIVGDTIYLCPVE